MREIILCLPFSLWGSTQHDTLSLHPHCELHDFVFSYIWVVFHCLYIKQLLVYLCVCMCCLFSLGFGDILGYFQGLLLTLYTGFSPGRAQENKYAVLETKPGLVTCKISTLICLIQNHSSFIYSPVVRLLNCFQIFATLNSAAMQRRLLWAGLWPIFSLLAVIILLKSWHPAVYPEV